MFTETMRRGKDFYVVKGDGKLVDVECALSRDHDQFRMRWEFKTRTIPIQDVVGILSWEEASELNLGYQLDGRCATVELETGECITFNFGHTEACERFIFCMRLLFRQKRQRFASNDFQRNAGPVSDPKPKSRKGKAVAAMTPADAQQAMVEAFVRQMVGGCKVGVVGPGGAQQVLVSMEADLRAL